MLSRISRRTAAKPITIRWVEAAAAAGAEVGVCVVANDNNKGNVVISGDKAAVDLAIEKAKELGARAIPLNVSAPFHCPLMQPAADAMAEALAATPPGTLRTATRLEEYRLPLLTTGSARFSITAGTLPRGLNLTEEGVITGMPDRLSLTTFTVRASAPDGTSSLQDFRLAVAPPAAGQPWSGGVYAGDYDLVLSVPEFDRPSPAWGPLGTDTQARSARDGSANTGRVLNAGRPQHEVARRCDELVLGGYDDWYLPAEEELLSIQRNAARLGLSGRYFSSTEAGPDAVRAVDPAAGASVVLAKNAIGVRMRCARRASLSPASPGLITTAPEAWQDPPVASTDPAPAPPAGPAPVVTIPAAGEAVPQNPPPGHNPAVGPTPSPAPVPPGQAGNPGGSHGGPGADNTSGHPGKPSGGSSNTSAYSRWKLLICYLIGLCGR